METKICEFCGKKYGKPKFRITHKSWNERKYCSRECRGLVQKGKKKTAEQKKNMKTTFIGGHSPWNKGLKYTEKQKLNLNIEGLKDNWCGRKGSITSEETKKKIGDGNRGKIVSEETKKKLSEFNKSIGKCPIRKYKQDHWNWKGGITPINTAIRKSLEGQNWRKNVLFRDNYTCRFCGVQSSKGNYVYLEVDHIKPFCLFKELRFDINNGRTLCKDCHSKTDTYKKSLRQLKILFNIE